MTEKKKSISISSRKAKGRNLQKWIANKLSDISGIAIQKDGDIESRPMSQSGTDIILRGEALEIFPWSIEAKNQEKWSVLAWIRQAKENTKKNLDWLLFCKKNHHEEIVIMDAQYFLDLYYELHDLRTDKEKENKK